MTAQREVAHIYIDESSQTDNRYLVLGAVVVPGRVVPALECALAEARLPELPHSELKWAKVSKSKILAYERFIRVFFTHPEVDFHSIVVDTSQLRHRVFNAGDRDRGFNKEIYQLVMKCGRLYSDPVFHVFPDRRSTIHPTEELRTIINHGMHKKLGRGRDWPVRKLHFADWKDRPLLQVADLFAGAIAYRCNGHDQKEGASRSRVQLASLVLGLARVQSPLRDTALRGKFTIWHRVLRK
jgi:hypothetical protein